MLVFRGVLELQLGVESSQVSQFLQNQVPAEFQKMYLLGFTRLNEKHIKQVYRNYT